MSALLVNSGSSSLKMSLREISSSKELASSLVDWSGTEVRGRLVCADGEHRLSLSIRESASAFKAVLEELRKHVLEKATKGLGIRAVVHRVVHGGEFADPAMLITDGLLSKLEEASALAPLHNPPSIEAIQAARAALPGVPHIAAFDTAFHRTMVPEATQYAVPEDWTNQRKIKRYGFHGLSHSYCARRAAEILRQPLEGLRLVICHLGHGCSASAVRAGKCLDTTMGFTPLDGLMMATRSGSIDPGAVLYVQQRYSMTADEVQRVLNGKSGLLGVSGISADMRQVLEAADEGHESSRLAIAMFCYRVRQAIAALLVPLAGADALVFTAGIGENSPRIREQICNGLQFLGFVVDPQKNTDAKPDSDIASSSSASRILVVTTQEDLSMLHELRQILKFN